GAGAAPRADAPRRDPCAAAGGAAGARWVVCVRAGRRRQVSTAARVRDGLGRRVVADRAGPRGRRPRRRGRPPASRARITGPSRRVPACGRQRCGSEHAVSDTPQIRNVFIRRPIFSGVISIVIVLLGLFSLRALPVNSSPSLTPPETTVQAVSPSASAHAG